MPHSPPPNLLLITSDQQHWTTLGFLNPKIQTPNLDRLAARGTNFSRAYCPNPTCTPTRASILTGQYPSTHGAYTLGTKLPEDADTVGDHLRAAGYQTSLIGKAHFQPLASTDEYPSVEAYPTLRDLDFWRSFNDRHTPWYGFDHVELTRNHTDEGHVGQHYGIWLEEQGLTDWRDYFQVRNDGVKDTPTDGTKAPNYDAGPEQMHWQLPEELHYTAWTGKRTHAAIQRARDDGQPFFIWSSYHDPHPPYAVPEPWASMYDPDDMEIGEFVEGEFDDMPEPHHLTRRDDPDFSPYNGDGFGNHGYNSHQHDPQRLKQEMAIYYGMVSFMDHWIGQTLDQLEALGQRENTLVVFTSDHGHFLGQHGLIAKGPFHYEDVIRVPFLAAWGDKIEAGQTSDAIQTLVDLAPTFLDAAGLEVPRGMQGISQLPAWTAAKDFRGRGRGRGRGRDHAIVENHHNDSEAVHLRTLVTDRWKLTVYRGRSWGELFDLRDDPNERHNRYDDPAFTEVRHEMMSRLVQADLEREPTPMPRLTHA
jgi:uncharacterized sulfatase